ncbi:hypothetical protein JCM3765_006145 [Sporobolomyces pararoseus]
MSRHEEAWEIPPKAPMPPGYGWPEDSSSEESGAPLKERLGTSRSQEPSRRRQEETNRMHPSKSRGRRDSGVGIDGERGKYDPRKGLAEMRAAQEKSRSSKEGERNREEDGSTRKESVPGTYYIYNATTKAYLPFPPHLDVDSVTGQIFKRRTGRENQASTRKEDSSSNEEAGRPLRGFRTSQPASSQYDRRSADEERYRRSRYAGPPPAAYYNERGRRSSFFG